MKFQFLISSAALLVVATANTPDNVSSRLMVHVSVVVVLVCLKCIMERK